MQGGHRNYPASGQSVLLPLKLHSGNQGNVAAEVLICGGSAHTDFYTKGNEGVHYVALQDYGRMRITDLNLVWKRDLMPSPRLMGDMLLLPSSDVLLINGAKRGSSGWGFARNPNFTPAIYNPRVKRGERFRKLAPTTIPRMYHSTATVLQDDKSSSPATTPTTGTSMKPNGPGGSEAQWAWSLNHRCLDPAQ
ncbi:unnamed protein product [Linum tenue]|uniref:Glyoxal oxidase N-terminal domain-containing protein n=1 Tax=Linum tenue TaxID=586396 RepID=A0AAV0HY66_9ROSI|nr:unnamed protein product [Linum tenue]